MPSMILPEGTLFAYVGWSCMMMAAPGKSEYGYPQNLCDDIRRYVPLDTEYLNEKNCDRLQENVL